MTSFCKDTRTAGLRFCLLVVALLSVLATAQADPAGPFKYFVAFAPQDDVQILAIAEHGCNFTEVNFAVGTGVKNSYHCHVLSGVDVLLGRAAPVANRPNAANTVNERNIQYTATSGTTTYPAVRKPTPNPGYTTPQGGAGGMIVISFDTPAGTEVHQFSMYGNNLRALESPDGAVLHFTSQWRVLNSDVPAIGQLSPGPYAMDMNAPAGTPAKPLPTATSKLHLDVRGTDCTAQYEGLPKIDCAIARWSPQQIIVYVSGAYLKQPGKYVAIELAPVFNDPGHWFFTPTQFTPYSPLLAAVQQNDVAAVQTALAQGADPSDHPTELEAPLATAVQRRNLDIANLLVDRGADVNATSKAGASVLAIAIRNAANSPQDHARWFEFIKKLISHHVDMDRVAPGSLTPLMAAMILSVQRDVVELLLDSGANVNATATLSQGLFGLSGRPITAYDLGQAELDAFNQEIAMQGLTQGETNPIAPLQGVMALLAQHGAKFLPNGGALASDRIHFENRSGGSLTLVGSPGAAVYGETVTVADVTTGKTFTGPVAKDGAFRVEVAGAPADLYGAKLSRDKLSGSQVYLHGDDPALSVHVDSPVPGSAVDTDQITVTGTYTGPANMGIMIGGGPAARFGNHFVVENVHLQPGRNTLTLYASTLGGLKLTQQFDVTSRRGEAFGFRALSTPGQKTDPLQMGFIVWAQNPSSVHTLKIAYLGGAKDDLVTSDPGQIQAAMTSYSADRSPLAYRYPAPGIYDVRVTLVDAKGAATTLTEPVVLGDPDEVDKAIRSAWRDYTAALAAGDEDAALAMLSDEGRDKMKDVLPTILPKGREIVASFSPLMGDKPDASATEAEYVIHRSVQGPGGNTFFIGFIRYPDGVWHIDSM